MTVLRASNQPFMRVKGIVKQRKVRRLLCVAYWMHWRNGANLKLRIRTGFEIEPEVVEMDLPSEQEQ